MIDFFLERMWREIETTKLEDGIYMFSDRNITGGANAYLLQGQKHDYLIDCLSGAEGDNLWEKIQPLRRHSNEKLVILLSHTHADHAGGLADFPADAITLYSHPSAIDALKTGSDRDQVARLVSRHMKVAQFDNPMELFDGQLFPLVEGKTNIQCLLTPGHSMDSVCFLANNSVLFTGDTFYPDMKQTLVKYTFGKFEDLANSWNRLSLLEGVQKVCPGHSHLLTFDEFVQQIPGLTKKIPRKKSRV